MKLKFSKVYKTTIMFTLFICFNACVHSPPNATNLDNKIISWNSPEGMSRLSESQHKVDFFTLANHFEAQQNTIFCGPASAAIVLNSMYLHSSANLPQDHREFPKNLLRQRSRSPFYKRFSQTNIFAKSPKSMQTVLGSPNSKGQKDYGFQIRQLQKLLQAHGTQVKLRIVDKKLDLRSAREEMITNLARKNDYVVVNYARKGLNQKGGGHISPIGAYHRPSNSFLVMDVTPNKAPWVWVPASTLMNAMNTHDTNENRGFVLISR